MDGKVFPMSEYQPGTTAPPFHVWCRSTTVPHFDDDFGQIGERAARDKDGKTYYVPADMSYKEWQKSFVDGGSKEGLRETTISGAEFEEIRIKAQETEKEYEQVQSELAQVQRDKRLAALGGFQGAEDKLAEATDRESELQAKATNLKEKIEKLIQSVKIPFLTVIQAVKSLQP